MFLKTKSALEFLMISHFEISYHYFRICFVAQNMLTWHFMNTFFHSFYQTTLTIQSYC